MIEQKDATNENRIQPKEDKVAFSLFKDDQKNLYLGNHGKDVWDALRDLLSMLHDVFAWSAKELSGVPSSNIMHSLNLKDDVRCVVRQRRNLVPERAQASSIEVQKLLKVGFIKEIQYTRSISNLVLVKKSKSK